MSLLEFSRILLGIAMILSCSLAVVLFMVGELLVGLIAIAISIAFGLGSIWYVLRGEKKIIQEIQNQITTNLTNIEKHVNDTNNRLQQIIMSSIDEKIAVFSIHIDTIHGWGKKEDILESAYRNDIDRIKSDIDAVSKYATSMNENQKRNSLSALRKIVEKLENKGYHNEAGEIKDMSVIIFPSL